MTRHLFNLLPPWAVGALAARWWMTFDPATLAVAGIAAVVELTLWYQRAARAQVRRAMLDGDPMGAPMERWLLEHPAPVIALLVVFGVAIYVGRAIVAVARFVWWLVLSPAVLVNRQRYQRAQALRRATQAEEIMRLATDQSQVAAGASLKARALQAAQVHLGLEPGHDRLPTRARPVALENRPPPPAAIELPGPEIAQVAIIHGLVSTFEDGSHRFEPMAPAVAEVDR